MNTVRIVIALNESIADAISALLSPHRELQVVALVHSEVDLFIAVRDELSRHPQLPDDPLVVITSFDEHNDLPPACTRLIEEFPGLIAYGIHQQSTLRYRSCIEVLELPGSLDALLIDLRSLSTDLPPAFKPVPSRSRELDR